MDWAFGKHADALTRVCFTTDAFDPDNLSKAFTEYRVTPADRGRPEFQNRTAWAAVSGGQLFPREHGRQIPKFGLPRPRGRPPYPRFPSKTFRGSAFGAYQ